MAVMDLGTNTFHLLIAEKRESGSRILLTRTDPVRLGEGGITAGHLQPEAFARGVAMLETYAGQIAELRATTVRAMATSAIRSAKNGQEFVREVQTRCGIRIETIDGEQEASLIYEGVRASGVLHEEPALIMDIGGGSIEFILCDVHRILWKQSFEIGAARLMDRFHTTDPIPAAATEQLEMSLTKALVPLMNMVSELHPTRLIGSSGAFESFAALAEEAYTPETTLTYRFDATQLDWILEWICQSSHEERVARKKIVPVRIDMLVSAALVTRFILRNTGIEETWVTTASLKEGVLADLMKEA